MKIKFVGVLFCLLILIGFGLIFGVSKSSYLKQDSKQLVFKEDYCETEKYYQNIEKWLQQKTIQNKLNEIKPIINLEFVYWLQQKNFLLPSLMNYVERLLTYIFNLFLQHPSTDEWELSQGFENIPEQFLCHFPDLETDLSFLQELQKLKQEFVPQITQASKLQSFNNYHYLRIWLQSTEIQLSLYWVFQKNVFASTFPVLNGLTETVSVLERHPDYFFLVLKPENKINVTSQQVQKFVSWNQEKIKNIYQASVKTRSLTNGFPLILIAFILLASFTISSLWNQLSNSKKVKNSSQKKPSKN